jgi:hypothetical protein
MTLLKKMTFENKNRIAESADPIQMRNFVADTLLRASRQIEKPGDYLIIGLCITIFSTRILWFYNNPDRPNSSFVVTTAIL